MGPGPRPSTADRLHASLTGPHDVGQSLGGYGRVRTGEQVNLETNLVIIGSKNRFGLPPFGLTYAPNFVTLIHATIPIVIYGRRSPSFTGSMT